jgi:hypothetical protein
MCLLRLKSIDTNKIKIKLLTKKLMNTLKQARPLLPYILRHRKYICSAHFLEVHKNINNCQIFISFVAIEFRLGLALKYIKSLKCADNPFNEIKVTAKINYIISARDP